MKKGTFEYRIGSSLFLWVVMLGVLLLGTGSPLFAQPAGVASCVGCHGADGVSQDPDVPTIAGMSSVYLADQLYAFQSEERPCVYEYFTKTGTTGNHCLMPPDMDAVAEYFARLPFRPAIQDLDPDKVAAGEAIHDSVCAVCHSAEGSNPEDDAGILAGQWKPYLIRSLTDFQTGERMLSAPKQRAINRLSGTDIQALAEYYASAHD